MKKLIIISLCIISIFLVVVPASASAPTYFTSEQVTAIRAIPEFGTRYNEVIYINTETNVYTFIGFQSYTGIYSFYYNSTYQYGQLMQLYGAFQYTSTDGINWTQTYSYALDKRNYNYMSNPEMVELINGTSTTHQILSSREDLLDNGIVFFSKSIPYLEIPLTLNNQAKQVELKPLEQVVKLLPTLTLLVVFSLGFWKAYRMLYQLLARA